MSPSLPPSLPPSRSPPFLPAGFPAVFSRRGSFSVDTWELLRRRVLVYSLAITITLGTPAPPCPSVLSRFSLCSFLLLVRVLPELSLFLSLSRPFALCMYVCVRIFPLASSHRFFAMSSLHPPLFFPSWRIPIILSRRPRLFRNCFRVFLLLLRLLLLRGTFYVPSVTAVLYRRDVSFSLFLFFFFLSPFSSRFFVCLVSLVLTPSFSITRC